MRAGSWWHGLLCGSGGWGASDHSLFPAQGHALMGSERLYMFIRFLSEFDLNLRGLEAAQAVRRPGVCSERVLSCSEEIQCCLQTARPGAASAESVSFSSLPPSAGKSTRRWCPVSGLLTTCPGPSRTG